MRDSHGRPLSRCSVQQKTNNRFKADPHGLLFWAPAGRTGAEGEARQIMDTLRCARRCTQSGAPKLKVGTK